MALLLDTHIWLWSLLDPARLSKNVREALTAPDNTLHLSSISFWEALLLAERGRLSLKPDVGRWIRNAIATSPVSEVPLSLDVVLASTTIKLPHRDPADRLIAASAKAFDLTLVTADRRLIACDDVEVLVA